ncbi:hypothetical protein G9A89_009643 [Geosiphon pyriformis]|nr:hypothetical protein G9A89_009643 [Geosiphon pyriformis]
MDIILQTKTATSLSYPASDSGLTNSPLRPPPLHLLPCEISYTGLAKVDTYFLIEEAEEPKAVYNGSLGLASSAPSTNFLTSQTLATSSFVENEADEREYQGKLELNSSSNGAEVNTGFDSEKTVDIRDKMVVEELDVTKMDIDEIENNPDTKADTRSASKEKVYSSYFRGRKLIGREVVLIKGYEGYIFEETGMKSKSSFSSTLQKSQLPTPPDIINYEDPISDLDLEILKRSQSTDQEMVRCWEATRKFDRFVVWGHDELPEQWNDDVIRSLEWLEIAKAIHQPTPPVTKV